MYPTSRLVCSLSLVVAAWIWAEISCRRAWSQDDVFPAPKLEVTVDGEFRPPIVEYAGRDGDQAKYLFNADIVVMLGPERELHFRSKGDWAELLYLEVPGQPPRLVGVQVLMRNPGDNKVLVNPLASLSNAEIHGLWGINVGHWSDSIAEKLKQIDPARTIVNVSEGAAMEHSVPPLPAALTMLRIESRNPFDCSLLQQATRLQYLNLEGTVVRNTGALAKLTQLQVLNGFRCEGLTNVAFAKSMPMLERLNISETEVADLSPLDGLPKLQSVQANLTPVGKLPVAVPSLRELNIMSSKLTDTDVHAFRRANPQCQVRHRWGELLLAELQPTTRLRVRTGGTCHRYEAGEQTLFSTNQAEEIKQLLAGIEIAEELSGFHCMCCGNPSLEFYNGDQLLVTLGFHHGESLRWRDGWPGDAAITQQSAIFLVSWLANRNITGPLKEREAAAERARAEARKIVQATTGMSATLAKVLTSDPEKFQAALIREQPDKGAQVEVWLRILGTGNDSWSSLQTIEQLNASELLTYDAKTLAVAVEKALLGTDRQLKRGAARLWMSYESPLQDWAPPNIGRLHKIVLQLEQEARYYPIRMSALDDLARWNKEFSAEELARHLAAGLHDPAPQVRRKAMLVAGRMGHTPSVDSLMRVLDGVALETQPLPDVPVWEARDVPEGFGDVAAGCSDVEVAALALGDMQYLAAKPVIASKQPSTPMFEVALALLGDGARLKPEHFASKDENQELQLAAVRAVIRSKGKYGLQLAIDYKQAKEWSENELVATELSRMLRVQDAPGSDALIDCDNLKTLQQWFTDHGAEYLKRLERNP